MEKIRKCKSCGKELNYFEGSQIPIFIPSSLSFPLPSGGVELYCKECYKDAIGEPFVRKEKKPIQKKKVLSNNFKVEFNPDGSLKLPKHLIKKKEI